MVAESLRRRRLIGGAFLLRLSVAAGRGCRELEGKRLLCATFLLRLSVAAGRGCRETCGGRG